jgi:hypothetical protein
MVNLGPGLAAPRVGRRLVAANNAESTRPSTVLDRLGPVRKAKLMLALIGLVVLGLGLIALVLMGGWAVRRQARRRTGPSRANPNPTGAAPYPRADYLHGPIDGGTDRERNEP